MEAHASTPAVERRRGWGRWVVIALVGLFIALLLYGIESRGPDDAIDDALAEGRAPAAPAFTLEVLDAGSVAPLCAVRWVGRWPTGALSFGAPRHPGRAEPLGLVVHAVP